ncbi:type I restriction-modification system subunit M [Bergeriella denitrificans]|uniref:site-specific DNA-methyltransferase (adenine-specific) n=1 Tax=Bergeriella denitrificans TaxID=494 RepID=A0A378UJ61_BERDE|nr:class I SAM-dependent DNA methyltransferase [Bergeriella denitrificans]STZ76531.1 type I restriction-modification system methyltransferase [Bergeriella denitrificans]
MTAIITQYHPHHSTLVSILWNIANGLRGTYRPPQYRRVMLPLIVLARFDAILSQHTDEMKAHFEANKSKPQLVLDKELTAIVGKDRKQTLYNTSGFNLARLLDDPEHIRTNLIKYIGGFSAKAKDIFDKFEFEKEIDKLDEANRLFKILQTFVGDLQSQGLTLSPDVISNSQMGYLFEELIRKFNEQANEEAGDHFTPREVIRLMVNIAFAEDHAELQKPNVHRTIYDPTCGTGGMLSESEKELKGFNNAISLGLYGQEYNAESYAICCADLLIKDEPAEHIVFGDTLGVLNAKDKGNGFTPHDGHSDRRFDYMFANPPFGVEWKIQEDFVKKEHQDQGFNGRFGAGLPRINDGSLLFLQHMLSKMKQPETDAQGSRIAVVFNGSPLFTGDAGSGESNIRRYVIENDLLEAVIALPDQMFYNTGIYTYIWVLSNKKNAKRQGKVQLINATQYFQKMQKSLGNKRNELSEQHIADITRLYAEFKQNKDSKIFNNQDFAYLKVIVERPLRLNFQASSERIEKLWEQTAFANLAKSKKIKDAAQIKADETQGLAQQQAIIAALNSLEDTFYTDRKAFLKVLDPILKALNFSVSAPLKKAILEALSEQDQTADICTDSKGNKEADPQLRDSELVPLPSEIAFPLNLGYDNQTHLDELLTALRPTIEAYMQAEVLPHVPDAWVDESKTKLGYEIPINRHFYEYKPPRDLSEIKVDIVALEKEIMQMLGKLQ